MDDEKYVYIVFSFHFDDIEVIGVYEEEKDAEARSQQFNDINKNDKWTGAGVEKHKLINRSNP